MAVNKPGAASNQADIKAYIKQEVAKMMKAKTAKTASEGPKRSVAKKATPTTKLSKQLTEKAKKGKPAPKLS